MRWKSWPLWRLFAFLGRVTTYNGKVIVESDSRNAVSYVSSLETAPWTFQFHLNEIKSLSSLIQVEFQHVGRPANAFADYLAKQVVDRSFHFVVSSL